MNAEYGKMIYRMAPATQRNNVAAEDLTEACRLYFYPSKEGRNTMFITIDEDRNLYLISSEKVYPLTAGKLNERDFYEMLDKLSDENVLFPDGYKLLQIWAKDYYPESHLFYYTAENAAPINLQILHLYCTYNLRGAIEIMFRSGLTYFGAAALHGFMLHNTSGTKCEDILYGSAYSFSELKYFNTGDGISFLSEATADEIDKVLYLKQKYKLDGLYNRKLIGIAETIDSEGERIFSKSDKKYLFYAEWDRKKITKAALMKQAVSEVFDYKIPVCKENLLSEAYQIVLRLDETDALYKEREKEKSWLNFMENEYSIGFPKSVFDMVDAQRMLSNCLLSYVFPVGLGCTTILILYRKKEVVGAVEVRADMSVSQAYLAKNRPITKSSPVDSFLRVWAREKGIVYDRQ